VLTLHVHGCQRKTCKGRYKTDPNGPVTRDVQGGSSKGEKNRAANCRE